MENKNHSILTNLLIKLTGQKIFLPFYHTISDVRLPHISNLYNIRSVKIFESDLDYLCDHYNPISIQQLYEIIKDKKALTRPVFHLTFDDGLKEITHIIAPILERRGIPATFFINSAFVDNKELFYRYKVSLLLEKLKSTKHLHDTIHTFLGNLEHHKTIKNKLLSLTYNDLSQIDSLARILEVDFDEYLQTHRPYLDTSQIKDLILKGFNIGSHSVDHPWFKDIGIQEKKKQVTECTHFLKATFGLNELYFSFPFSDEGIQKDFIRWMIEDEKCKLVFGTSGLNRENIKYHIHRTAFDGRDLSAQAILCREYILYSIKAVFNKNRINRI